MLQLVREFLEFYNLEATLSVFLPEAAAVRSALCLQLVSGDVRLLTT